MIFRVLGLAITFGIIGYMFYAMNKSNVMIDKNPAMMEQKQVLQDAGVNTATQDELKAYAIDQAKQIENYQNGGEMPSEDAPLPVAE